MMNKYGRNLMFWHREPNTNLIQLTLQNESELSLTPSVNISQAICDTDYRRQ